MDNWNYSITGNDDIDNFLNILSGDIQSEESRFKFQIGDIVLVEDAPNGNTNNTGDISEIRHRRNAYPPPLFEGYWFPIYYLNNLKGTNGGEIHENCLRLATDEEIQQLTINLVEEKDNE